MLRAAPASQRSPEISVPTKPLVTVPSRATLPAAPSNALVESRPHPDHAGPPASLSPVRKYALLRTTSALTPSSFPSDCSITAISSFFRPPESGSDCPPTDTEDPPLWAMRAVTASMAAFVS